MRAALAPARLCLAARALHCRRLARSVRVRAMAAEPIFDIAVKGFPETGVLGDCERACRARSPAAAAVPPVALTRPPHVARPAGPFCHRALLVLEEKHVPYCKTLIDFAAKPQWLLGVNPAGTVPVMKELATGEWTVDSGVIAEALEARFPEPALGVMQGAGDAGGAVFGAFKDFAKAGDAEAAAKEAALVAALREMEEHLRAGGPYVGGATPNATDVSLMPKLYHATVALRHFRGWELPAELTAVRAYMAAFMARDSWQKTLYSEELVIKGWERHGLEVKK
jgi:glutathione S-transferase